MSNSANAMSWSERLQRIDSRWLYLALIVAVAIPVFVRVRPPIPATRETLGVYRAIEQAPPDRLIMLNPTWDAGTIGECEGQFRALVEHVMRRGLRFVVWTYNAPSPPFYNRVIEATAKKYGRVYGRDWADFGFKTSSGDPLKFAVQAMARDFPGFMKADVRGTPVEQIPVMRGVKDATAFSLAVSCGYNPTLEFVQFMQAVYGTKVVFAAAAIHSTTLISYFDSRQIVGYLVGARGGAEYETLVGAPGIGVDVIVAQSFGHVLIIALIVLGNAAMFAGRRRARTRPA